LILEEFGGDRSDGNGLRGIISRRTGAIPNPQGNYTKNRKKNGEQQKKGG